MSDLAPTRGFLAADDTIRLLYGAQQPLPCISYTIIAYSNYYHVPVALKGQVIALFAYYCTSTVGVWLCG